MTLIHPIVDTDRQPLVFIKRNTHKGVNPVLALVEFAATGLHVSKRVNFFHCGGLELNRNIGLEQGHAIWFFNPSDLVDFLQFLDNFLLMVHIQLLIKCEIVHGVLILYNSLEYPQILVLLLLVFLIKLGLLSLEVFLIDISALLYRLVVWIGGH